MIRNGYIDDGIGGGDENKVNELIGNKTWVDGKPVYDGNISKILALGSFSLKVKGHNGKARPKVKSLLGSGVL